MKHDYVTALGYLNLALEALVAIKGQLPAQWPKPDIQHFLRLVWSPYPNPMDLFLPLNLLSAFVSDPHHFLLFGGRCSPSSPSASHVSYTGYSSLLVGEGDAEADILAVPGRQQDPLVFPTVMIAASNKAKSPLHCSLGWTSKRNLPGPKWNSAFRALGENVFLLLPAPRSCPSLWLVTLSSFSEQPGISHSEPLWLTFCSPLPPSGPFDCTA